MERRVLLEIFLSFLTLSLWRALTMPGPTPSKAEAPATPAPAAGADTAAPAVRAPEPPKPLETLSNPLFSETTEREIRLENQDVVATLTNRGGRLKSWR